MANLPGAVLFACNLNRIRSPMAEGLMKRRFGNQIYVDSCGLRAGEDDHVDPFVMMVMDEVGVDLTGHRGKSFEDVEAHAFDLVISLSPEAHHRAVELTRGRAVEIEYWPTLDPTLTHGTRESVMGAYRAVRGELEDKIRRRFGEARTFGG
ncbi:MAG: low molecular weight phosphatase family protein [Caulobacteraceae bacterium]